MDPLSFTASLFALIGGAKAGAKTLEKIASYRHAPREIKDLREDLERFVVLLQDTIKLVGDLDDMTLKTRGKLLTREVDRATSKIEDIDRLLSSPNALAAMLHDGEQARAIWMQNKKKITTIQADLRHTWVTINYALGILGTSTTNSMRHGVNASVAIGQANAKTLGDLVNRIDEQAARPLLASAMSETIAAEPDIPPLSDAAAREPQEISKGSDKSWAWRTTPIKTSDCHAWCSCRCHTRKTFKTPYRLTSVLGHVVVEQTTTGPTCNEHSCRRSQASSLNINYNLPKYISTTHFSFTIAHTPLIGKRFTLRLHRVRDWMHLLLMYANEGNIIAIQKLFSEAKASPHDVNQMGQTALHYATQHPKLYRFLIEKGGDGEVTDIHGNKPIEMIGERLLCAELEEADAYTISKSLEETDFMETRQFSVIHKIVLGIARRSLEDELALSTATINTLDSKGRTPLAWATLRNDTRSVDILLAHGADPNICDESGCSCLHFVRGPEVCSELLDKKANVNLAERTLGMSCMQAVCKSYDNPKVINLLHRAGADVNFRDSDGETPLMNAIFKKHTCTARRLIELGADVNAANYSSRDSPFHFAVLFDHHEIIPVLLEHGADYTSVNGYNRTLASEAAQTAGPQTLQILANANLAGLDLSLKDEHGTTAAEHMKKRDFFADSEVETRQAFEMLQESILNLQEAAEASRKVNFCALTDSDRIQLPGAYPRTDSDRIQLTA